MEYPRVADGFSTVAIDFDDTLAESRWPSNRPGQAIEGAMDMLLFYYGQGYEIVIYTARPSSHAPLIWSWLQDHGVGNVVHDVVCDKPRAGLYIDDRAWNPWPQKWMPDVVDPKQEEGSWEVLG